MAAPVALHDAVGGLYDGESVGTGNEIEYG